MAQNNVCRLENPDYGKYTISSLKRIAEAMDVALVVRLVPFSQYIDWLSGTPHRDEGLRPESLAVPSFEEESKSGVFEREIAYWPVITNPGPSPVTFNQSISAWPTFGAMQFAKSLNLPDSNSSSQTGVLYPIELERAV